LNVRASLPDCPWWLPGGNVQTIWSAKLAMCTTTNLPAWVRERWDTPDGDFVDVDWLTPTAAADPMAPLLVLFHGLEGSSQSHYAQAFASVALQRGWRMAVPHFRGCSGELNRGPRAYHSGDHEEIGWILNRLKARSEGAVLGAVGVSLGGNALMRWAEEAGSAAGQATVAVVAVSSPLDLTASGQAIDRGFNRQVYARMFLETMVRKAEAKWRQFPGLFDLEKVRASQTLYAFDDAFTAPLHGFAGTDDYWRRASAKPALDSIRIPALLLNARNDPFVPAASLPQGPRVGRCVEVWQPSTGGHVGFCVSDERSRVPGHVLAMPEAVTGWLERQGVR
jgi:uncharacterized protein